jgi:inosine-uridine nucleoside N-ribohydrolase
MTRFDFCSLALSLLFTGTVSVCNLSPAAVAKPVRVILDHDGAFEANYAILTLAIASQLPSPPVRLMGVTTAATGEAYCNHSNGYPTLKRIAPDLIGNFRDDEGTVDGLTQKVLSIAQYQRAKIYSGCDERVASISLANQTDVQGNPLPNTGYTELRFQLPFGGKKAFAPCLFHQEFGFSRSDVVCWNEFNKPFRDETMKYVLPTSQTILSSFKLPELALMGAQKASEYLAESMCEAYGDRNPLTIVLVGPPTNLARAYQKIETNPRTYGCPRKINLAALGKYVSTRFMGGVWDLNQADNFDANGKYRLNQASPTWSAGNIYYQDGSHLFGEHHLPDTGTGFEAIQTHTHKNIFNSLNHAEANFWTDAVAVDKILKSGIPVDIIPLNATDSARLKGFDDRLTASPVQCATASAQFIKKLQLANQLPDGSYVYDTLFFWDTLAVASVWKDFVNFEDFRDLEITTLTNGDPTTVTGQLPAAELFRRDIGTLFRRGKVNHPVKLALSAKPASGDPNFQTTIQNYVFGLVCTAKS